MINTILENPDFWRNYFQTRGKARPQKAESNNGYATTQLKGKPQTFLGTINYLSKFPLDTA